MKLMWRLLYFVQCPSHAARAGLTLLEFSNPAQRGLRHPCQPRSEAEAEPDPAPFVNVGLPSFVVVDGNEFPPKVNDEPILDSWLMISGGKAKFNPGIPGKVYGAPGEYTLGS
jgi:hypothetical protein